MQLNQSNLHARLTANRRYLSITMLRKLLEACLKMLNTPRENCQFLKAHAKRAEIGNYGFRYVFDHFGKI